MSQISFCLYGSDLKYYVGAKKNIEINKELLPDWKTVIYYHPNNILPNYVEELALIGGVMVDVSTLPLSEKLNYPMFWRYLSFLNDGVNIIRDLDSRISLREVNYINQWLSSDSNYFIIRDHPWQSPVPGGLFGVKNSKLGLLEFFESFVKSNMQGWGTDQDMLSTFMYTIERNNISYFGFDRPETYIRRDNTNFFIGMQLNEFDLPVDPSAILALDYLKQLGL